MLSLEPPSSVTPVGGPLSGARVLSKEGARGIGGLCWLATSSAPLTGEAEGEAGVETASWCLCKEHCDGSGEVIKRW